MSKYRPIHTRGVEARKLGCSKSRVGCRISSFFEQTDYQCCGSGMFIPDPRSQILIFTHPGSQISDPGSKNSNKRERWKKLDVKPFYVATKFNEIVNYSNFEVLRKKIWANFQRIIELITKKIVKKLFKIWSWDPGSKIRDLGSGKTHSGSRIQGSKRHRIPDPQHCWLQHQQKCYRTTRIGWRGEVTKRAVESRGSWTSKIGCRTKKQFVIHNKQDSLQDSRIGIGWQEDAEWAG
jgi:hypothetical protein